MQGAILRIFSATPCPGASSQVGTKLDTVSASLVTRQAGLIGYLAAHPLPGDDGEHLFISVWENVDKLVGFTGNNWSDAVLPDGYATLLANWNIAHWQVGGMSFASHENWHQHGT